MIGAICYTGLILPAGTVLNTVDPRALQLYTTRARFRLTRSAIIRDRARSRCVGSYAWAHY